MNDFKRIFEILLFWLCVSVGYFYQGFKNRRFLSHVKNYMKEALLHLEIFSKFIQEYKDFEDLQTTKHERLKKASEGLHFLLNGKDRYYYSLLMVVEDADPKYLSASLESALNLTASHYEILLGFKSQPSEAISQMIRKFKESYPERLKDRYFENSMRPSTSAIFNALADQAKGNYLFLFYPGDWVRPDLLYRYEQTLNFFTDQSNIVLFCDEYLVDRNYTPIPRTRTNKPEQPQFPYIFNDVLGKTLLIPKNLWESIQGLNVDCEGVQAFDLPLRLHEKGALFRKVPIHLYAVLEVNKTVSEHMYSLPQFQMKIFDSFKNYSHALQLHWNWEPGYTPNSVRGIPTLEKIPKVHVVMLYKDQKNMTLSALQHILIQTGVHVKVTAIDNNSEDRMIAQKLEEKGVEVMRVEEPFNYSRLNNIAVHQTKVAGDCDYILFLNNDVDLERDALLEMCRWIDQPGIGMVGCRLNYPNGLLQHGGVDIEMSRAAFIKSWHHFERKEKFKNLQKSNFIRITAAVTAACSLVKRTHFFEVGGFDEMWFPVAFSDTALAVKLRAKGLHCLYTPFAVGIHHESLSRKKSNIEDYESLTWTHRKFVEYLWKDKSFKFQDLANSDY